MQPQPTFHHHLWNPDKPNHMSIYALGDIQGCFNELTALLNKINFNANQDQLWLVGDLVNRGSQSLEVLRFIKALGNSAITVLGNHDLHILAVAYSKEKLKPSDTFTDVLNAPDCMELCTWLRQQALLHYDAKLGYALVHAGLPPQWNIQQAQQYAHEVETMLRSNHYAEFFAHMYGNEPTIWNEQLTDWDRLRMITNYFTRMRFCSLQGELELKVKGTPSEPPAGFLPWYKIPSRAHKDLKIIFGHWAALNGQTDEPNLFALDTGCVWGNCLTAMRLEDGKRFSVGCQEIAKKS